MFAPSLYRGLSHYSDHASFDPLMYQAGDLTLSHTHTLRCFHPPVYPDSVSQSHTDSARSILKVYCCSAIEAPLIRPALSTSFLLSHVFYFSLCRPQSPYLLHEQPLSISLPRASLLSSLVSLPDESRNRLSSLKWPWLAPSLPPGRREGKWRF